MTSLSIFFLSVIKSISSYLHTLKQKGGIDLIRYIKGGYKHCDLRFKGDVKANVPVPVFFFFDLNRLLSDPKTLFSEGSEAGAGSPLLKGEERFSGLNFKMIYKYGPYIYQNPGEKKRDGKSA